MFLVHFLVWSQSTHVWGFLRHHSFKVKHKFRNFAVCDPLNANSRVIGGPTFEFHLPWNEIFIPPRSEWRWPPLPLNQLSRIFFVLESLHYFTQWLCCLACCSFLKPSLHPSWNSFLLQNSRSHFGCISFHNSGSQHCPSRVQHPEIAT